MMLIRFDTQGGGFANGNEVAAAVLKVCDELLGGSTVGTVRDTDGRSVGSWIFTDEDVYEEWQ